MQVKLKLNSYFFSGKDALFQQLTIIEVGFRII